MQGRKEGGAAKEWTSTKEVRFGDLVRRERHRQGLTLRDVARALEVSISYLSDVELGNRKPFKTEALVILAQVLGIDVSLLMEAAAREEGILIRSSNPAILEAAALLRAKTDGLGETELAQIRKILGG